MQYTIISKGDLLRGIYQNINDWKVNDECADLWIKGMTMLWMDFGLGLE